MAVPLAMSSGFADHYTDTQLTTPQVQLILDRLVKPDARYLAVVENRIFQKSG